MKMSEQASNNFYSIHTQLHSADNKHVCKHVDNKAFYQIIAVAKMKLWIYSFRWVFVS